MFELLLIADSSGFLLGLLGVILFLISSFLVFIILIQRGKGGGIAGSLTGTAQSAFGARGGDILMWLTLTLTLVWILLCCVTIFFYSQPPDPIAEGKENANMPTNNASPNPINTEPSSATINDTEESENEAAAGETPSAVIPAIETNDSDPIDGASTEDNPTIDKPESANLSDDNQQTKDVPLDKKE
jgi:preprotein translocase subunit SecG